MSAILALQQSDIRPVRVLICAIAGFAFLQVFHFVAPRAWRAPPASLISCYETSIVYTPGSSSLDTALAHVRKRYPTLLEPAEDRKVVEAVRSAEAACPAIGCGRAEAKTYQRAIEAYVDHRLLLVTEVDRHAGAEGAKWAASRLRTAEAIDILSGLNLRTHYQTYRPTIRRDRVVTNELLMRGDIEKIVPCGRLTTGKKT